MSGRRTGAAYTPRMRSLRVRTLAALLCTVTLGASLAARAEPDWSRFRGPNGSGISTATNVPTEFGPSKNLLWRLPLPGGHSSPDPPRRSHLPDGVSRGHARDHRDRPREGRHSLGAHGAGRSRRRSSTSGTTPHRRVRPSKTMASTSSFPTTASSRTTRPAKSAGRCRSDRSTTSTGWAPRR